MLVGLGHADLVCRDLDRSLEFYAHVFGPLGLTEPFLVEGERGEQIHYLRFPVPGSGSLGLRQAQEQQDFLLYGPGLHHLAFAVESRDDVDAVHERVVEAGGDVLHAPRAWPQYHPEYYGSSWTRTASASRSPSPATLDSDQNSSEKSHVRTSPGSSRISIESAEPEAYASPASFPR
jgi:glyoxylase I family protein